MATYCTDSSDSEISCAETVRAWVWVHVKKPKTWEKMYMDAHECLHRGDYTVYYDDPSRMDNIRRRLVMEIVMTHHVSVVRRDWDIVDQLHVDIDGVLERLERGAGQFGRPSRAYYEGEKEAEVQAEEAEDEAETEAETDVETEVDEEMTDYEESEADEVEAEVENDTGDEADAEMTEDETEAEEAEDDEKEVDVVPDTEDESDDEPISRAQLRPKFSSPVPDSDADTVAPSDAEAVVEADDEPVSRAQLRPKFSSPVPDECDSDLETVVPGDTESVGDTDDEPVSRAQLRPKFSSPVPDECESDVETVVPSDAETVIVANSDADAVTVIDSDADDDSDVETGEQLHLNKKAVCKSPCIPDSESEVDTDDILGAQTPEE